MGTKHWSSDVVTIKAALYKMIHRNKKSVDQIAGETGISPSYLYRMALPLDESGAKCPAEYVPPVTRSTGDYSLIRTLCALCGGIFVRVPRVPSTQIQERSVVSSYQTVCLTAQQKLNAFYADPSPEKSRDAADALNTVMQQSAGLQLAIEKHHQPELELSND